MYPIEPQAVAFREILRLLQDQLFEDFHHTITQGHSAFWPSSQNSVLLRLLDLQFGASQTKPIDLQQVDWSQLIWQQISRLGLDHSFQFELHGYQEGQQVQADELFLQTICLYLTFLMISHSSPRHNIIINFASTQDQHKVCFKAVCRGENLHKLSYDWQHRLELASNILHNMNGSISWAITSSNQLDVSLALPQALPAHSYTKHFAVDPIPVRSNHPFWQEVSQTPSHPLRQFWTFLQSPTPFLSQLNRILLDHYQHADWQCPELVAAMNYSTRQMVRLVSQVTYGQFTPSKYLAAYRIYHSIDQVAQTNLSLEEISYQVGFSSSQHFRRNFKTYCLSTPTAFRRKWKAHLQLTS